MKAFRRLVIVFAAVFVLIAAGVNIYLISSRETENGAYRVEAKKLCDELTETGTYDLSRYPHLTGVYPEGDGRLYISNEHYLVIESEGKLYRVEYSIDNGVRDVIAVNAVLGVILVLSAVMLCYIRRHIVVPFSRLNDIPQELAKGNLAVRIPEEKSRYFGKFTWGVNMLRESIEDSRKKEISMQRDKKLLLLSLSHDIKTPLSAIKLNAKALEKGLYNDEQRRREAAASINKRADEIEAFVAQISRSASEDFMNFEITDGEVFLSAVIHKIEARYETQLEMSHTEFLVGEYDDCILSCDPDRLGECLQNLVENAIKYSDGRQIALEFDRMDGCELITVVNTGCSLEEKELTQIFESFHRGSNSAKVQGNGLGLFICKRLMSLMGGDVYAEIRDGNFAVTLVVKLA
ncbi:MAG: HAMP domain-containing histidine kinase [Ruminococcus sp.]|nr:HAMP domain-containing histidine kinase [Ruminococcus sp.]